MNDQTGAWRELSDVEARAFNCKLLTESDALPFQFPYFNEWTERHPKLARTRYLLGTNQEPVAYVALLTLGFWPLRIGLIQYGPISLIEDATVQMSMIDSLRRWATKEGYIFLRLAHRSSDWMAHLDALDYVRCENPFPFIRGIGNEVACHRTEDRVTALGQLRRQARQEIKRAADVGYEISWTDRPEELSVVWPLFEEQARRKGIGYLPLVSFQRLMSAAKECEAVRLYVARFNGRAVQALMVLRSRPMALEYLLALDRVALGDLPSPNLLMQWQVMWDCYRDWGVPEFSFGREGASTPTYEWKRKLKPTWIEGPAPRVIVVRVAPYWMWTAVLLPALSTALRLRASLKSRMRLVISHVTAARGSLDGSD